MFLRFAISFSIFLSLRYSSILAREISSSLIAHAYTFPLCPSAYSIRRCPYRSAPIRQRKCQKGEHRRKEDVEVDARLKLEVCCACAKEGNTLSPLEIVPPTRTLYPSHFSLVELPPTRNDAKPPNDTTVPFQEATFLFPPPFYVNHVHPLTLVKTKQVE